MDLPTNPYATYVLLGAFIPGVVLFVWIVIFNPWNKIKSYDSVHKILYNTLGDDWCIYYCGSHTCDLRDFFAFSITNLWHVRCDITTQDEHPV